MKTKQLMITTAIAIAFVGIAAIIGLIQTGKTINYVQIPNSSVTIMVNSSGNITSSSYPYENLSALGFLEKNNIVNVTNSKYGAFINCINGLCSKKNYYWMYYINGKSAQVGVSAYFPRPNDTIDFEYQQEQ